MFFKAGVVLVRDMLHPRVGRLLNHDGPLDTVCREVFGMYGARVTSVLDGSHSRTSSHYDGRALDLGVKPFLDRRGFNHAEYFSDEKRTEAVELLVRLIDADPDIGPADDWFIADEGDHIHAQLRRAVP